MITETEVKNHRLTIQERMDVEGRFIAFGSQFGSFWGFNCGVVNSLISGVYAEEPASAATKMAIFTVPPLIIGLLAGSGAGVLASRIYLARK